MGLAARLRALGLQVLGSPRPPAPRPARLVRDPSGSRTRRRAKLQEDWREWSRVERVRLVAACVLLLLGTAAQAGTLVPWTLLSLGTLATVLWSRRVRDTLRLICYLSALLNVLGFVYFIVLLLPSSALMGLAGFIAPSGVSPHRRLAPDGLA